MYQIRLFKESVSKSPGVMISWILVLSGGLLARLLCVGLGWVEVQKTQASLEARVCLHANARWEGALVARIIVMYMDIRGFFCLSMQRVEISSLL